MSRNAVILLVLVILVVAVGTTGALFAVLKSPGAAGFIPRLFSGKSAATPTPMPPSPTPAGEAAKPEEPEAEPPASLGVMAEPPPMAPLPAEAPIVAEAPIATLAPPAPVAPPIPASGGFAVQVGAFAERANAENLARQIREQGFETQVIEAASSGKTVYKVRVGSEPTRERAEALGRDLETRMGLRGFIAW